MSPYAVSIWSSASREHSATAPMGVSQEFWPKQWDMSPVHISSVDLREFSPTAAKDTAPSKKGTPVTGSSGSDGHLFLAGNPNCARQPLTAR